MDIEKLNKTQIVLLTLLTSFVTSIATGIVTVTLMDQAPPAVTNTIHKVVEKTIETVTPETNLANASKEIVVVKEQDLVAEVVEDTSEVIIRIAQITEQGLIPSGLGVMVDKSGIIVTDSWNILAGNTYSVSIDKDSFDLEVLAVNEDRGVTYLKIIKEEDKIFKKVFKKAKIASVDSLKLGQSIVALGGIESTEIMTGIISGLVKDTLESEEEVATTTEEVTEKETILLSIKTNISPTGIVGGTPILNLDGRVIGLSTDPTSSEFIPLDFVAEDVENLLASDEE